jgi:hypothetical protein
LLPSPFPVQIAITVIHKFLKKQSTTAMKDGKIFFTKIMKKQ